MALCIRETCPPIESLVMLLVHPSSQCELWAEHVLQGLALGIGG